MAQNVALKELEKKAYKSTFEDGFWDIFWGMLIVGMSFGYLGSIIGLPEPLNYFLIPLIWYIIAFLIFFLGKRYITIPRMGFVKFGPKRKANKKKLIIFLSINVLINVIFLFLTFTDLFRQLQLEGFALNLIIGLFFALPLSIMAYLMQFDRLYLIAMLGGISFFFADLLNPYFGSPLDVFLAFSITGDIILIIGIVIFIRFLRKYPLLKEEVVNDN